MADAANEVINSLTKAAQCFKCNGVLRQPNIASMSSFVL